MLVLVQAVGFSVDSFSDFPVNVGLNSQGNVYHKGCLELSKPLEDVPYLWKEIMSRKNTVSSYCEGVILVKLVNLHKSAYEL